jgi:hypothetical protein
MKLVMTLLVRDEADIVSANIEFHLDRGVDFIIATDNLSVDGTTDILRAYERRGVLHYIRQTDDDYAQHRWVTHMARLARAKFGAEWVINNDADEFWYPEQGNLKEALDTVSASCDAVAVKRHNFPPRPALGGALFGNTMTVRFRQSLTAFGRQVSNKVCHRGFDDIEVEQGNHAVLRHQQILAAGAAPIEILHFPIRSYRQYANKISLGGAAYGRNKELDAALGDTWRHLYQLWRRGELGAYYRAAVLDDEEVQRGLHDNILVRDERLKVALSKLPNRAPQHD